MKRTLILLGLLIAAVGIAGRLTLVGQQYYTVVLDSGKLYKSGTDIIHYQDQKFYFNSTNTSTDAVDYSGFASLWVIPTIGSGTFDSCSVYGWLIDQYGRRLMSDSLEIATAKTWVSADTFNYKLDTIDEFDLSHGILIRIRHQTTTATDSASVKLGIWFEGR